MEPGKHIVIWYQENKRDLPWRNTRDPYLIWISEVILQQTRVDQGLPYYLKFTERFPSVSDLASAPEDEVLKEWQGLGYYSRALNLIRAARQIRDNFNGHFPESLIQIRSLSGIGEYTAAAIASLAFGLPVPVVDGNVRRFLSRYSGYREDTTKPDATRFFTGIATEWMKGQDPATLNQALMEFGSVVCRPSGPLCHQCVLRKECAAFSLGLTASIPMKTVRPAVKIVYLHYLVITCVNNGETLIYLRKRDHSGIWKNLFDFPSVETVTDTTLKKLDDFHLFPADQPDILQGPEVYGPVEHLLTHRRLFLRFYHFHLSGPFSNLWMAIPIREISRFAVPRPIERFLAAYPFV
jgi:A/G-specific adenine glycosylase